MAVRAAHFLPTAPLIADALPVMHPTAMQTKPTSALPNFRLATIGLSWLNHHITKHIYTGSAVAESDHHSASCGSACLRNMLRANALLPRHRHAAADDDPRRRDDRMTAPFCCGVRVLANDPKRSCKLRCKIACDRAPQALTTYTARCRCRRRWRSARRTRRRTWRAARRHWRGEARRLPIQARNSSPAWRR